MIRVSNSPNQVISSGAKRALYGFSGSLFFEKRDEGLRVSMLNPSAFSTKQVFGDILSGEELAKSALFTVYGVGSTCCVESIDFSTVVIPKQFKTIDSSHRPCAFITGSSRGIGLGIAEELVRDLGFCVALVGRDNKALKDAKDLCVRYGKDNQVITFSIEISSKNGAVTLNDLFLFLKVNSVLPCSFFFETKRFALSSVKLQVCF